MDKEKLLPSLRFSGYKDTWERNKLEHYLNVSNEKNTEGIFGKEDVLSVSGDFGIINQIEFHGRSFAGVSTANYGVVNTGDVVYTKSPLKANPFGIIKTNKGPAGIVSTLYAVYHPKENVYPDFIQVYFEQYARMNQYMHPLVNKGAKNDMKVSDANALKGEVVFPKVDEEKKIVEYFMNIDNLITLHQKEYDKLLIIKKAMLEKMFPKEGMDVPEIRFNEFSEPWERRKLGEYFKERSESAPEGELLSVTINSGIKKTSDLDRQDNSNEDKSKYKKVCIGDIAYNSMRMWQGASGYSPYEGIVSPAYTVLIPNEKVDSKCVSYLFKSTDMIRMFRINSQGLTSDTWNLKYPALSEIVIPLAKDVGEQKKIAAYFSHLDNLIALKQHKIEKLKNIKAGCLEKMFV